MKRFEGVASAASSPAPALVEMRMHAADAASLMKALGSENRLLILCVLSEGELSFGELNERIPLSQSALSQQLSKLRQEGLVTTRRESQTIFYSVAPGPADRIIHVLHDIYCGS
jgi:ArsR family transcriptional regulator, virulence genes transcriptional regulator